MRRVQTMDEHLEVFRRLLSRGLAEGYPAHLSAQDCPALHGQYVRDYSRIYGLPTVVFRMSCIYGPRQFGTEDQGWLAHFMIAAATGRPIGPGRNAGTRWRAAVMPFPPAVPLRRTPPRSRPR